MFQTIINKLFRRSIPTAVPLDIRLEAVRAEMERKPTVTVGKKADAPAKRGRGRPRKYGYYDLEVGESCREALSSYARSNLYMHARATGKVFTTKAARNGLWIKRVA